MNIEYDREKILEVYNIAKSAIGKTVRELIPVELRDENYLANKGKVGNLIQEHLFKIPVNSKSAPDFEDLFMELKVIPLKYNPNKEKIVKERMVLNNINFNEIVSESFETSSFLKKNKLILIMTYIHEYEKDKLDFVIDDAFVFDISKQREYKIIERDWNRIVDLIKKGQAENLSESLSEVLGACTKGANSNSVKSQPFSDIMAKTRAFSYKPSFLKKLLKNNLDRELYFEEVFSNKKVDYFLDYNIDQISDYLDKIKGTDISEYTNSRAKNSHQIAFKNLLKQSNKNLLDFITGSDFKLVVKLKSKKGIQEHIGTKYDLDPFEIINEEFENSSFYQEVILKTYIIILIDKETKKFSDYKFFSFSKDQIHKCKKVFYKTKEEISRLWDDNLEGRQLPNFVKIKDNMTIHLRPHAQLSKEIYRKGKKELRITKHQFWINKKDVFE